MFETFAIYSVFAVVIVWLIGLASWFFHHRCAICGNIHLDEKELKKCQKCGRLFCVDKSDQREIIRSNIKGVLGNGINMQKVNERKYYGKACGYIFIQTRSYGSSHAQYCRNHDPNRTKSDLE